MEKPRKSPAPSPATTRWIFIRGMGRASAHWGDYPKQFENEVPGAKVVTLDIPGSGKLSSKKSPSSISEMTDHLRDTYRRESAPEDLTLPTFLLGMSMGGMIVLDWIERYPDDLAGAVTINTSAAGINPVYRRLNPTALWAFLKIGLTFNPRQREKMILELTAKNPERRMAVLELWSRLATDEPIPVRNSARQLWACARFALPRTPPRKPLLMLNAAKDPIAHPSCSRAIANRWGVELRTHPSAGHDLPIDDPAWITASIQQWRSKV